MKLLTLIKMYLNEKNSKICVGNYLFDNYPIQNGLKQRDALSPLLFNFASEYSIKNVQENQVGLQLNGKRQLLVYKDDINLLQENIDTKKTEILIDASMEVGLEVNAGKSEYVAVSSTGCRQHHDIKQPKDHLKVWHN
jgi:hypothetical protein